MSKGKLVSGSAVSIFDMPSLEEGAGEPGSGPGDRRWADRRRPRSPADVEREAFSKGFEAGEKAGTEKVERDAARLIAGLKSAAASLSALRERIAREAEPQVVSLAVAIARRIVIEEIRTRPELIVGIVREALRRMDRAGTVTVRVHPDLYKLFSEARDKLSDPGTDITIDVDPSVPLSGPVVTSATEEVLTDVDDQIKAIAEELEERACR